MNKDRAKKLETELKGSTIGNWLVQDLLGYGKSAAVFKGEYQNCACALKIFDSEIVGKYGRSTQLHRIEREVSLSSCTHPNLVKIYEGGECQNTGHLYVAMKRINAPSLATVVKTLPRERIRTIIRDIARAARYLEESHKIAHRDIKPENIAISKQGAVLLDLSVLRSPAHPGGTDDSAERPFVGTLQYSPPEFLLRKEEDSPKGWRAVTFYQLGAVLYDLIEQKKIFSDFETPYARMVNAVQNETPEFSSKDVPADLINLAKRCLIKDPQIRLNLVSWDDFENGPTNSESPSKIARRQLKQRQELDSFDNSNLNSDWKQQSLLEQVTQKIHNLIRDELVSEIVLPPLSTHEIQQQPTDASFVLSFAPSNLIGLNEHFTLKFIVQLIDEGAMALKLEATAWISEEEIAPSITGKYYTEIYADIFCPETIVQKTQDFVLPAFNTALEIQCKPREDECLEISSSFFTE